MATPEIKQGEIAQELLASMCGVQLQQLAQDSVPHMHLLCRVLHCWDCVAPAVCHRSVERRVVRGAKSRD